MRRPTSIRSALPFLVLAATAVAAADAEPPPLVELLQTQERELDRRSFPAEALFVAESGEVGLGVRCATRPAAGLERELIDAAVADHLARSGTAHRGRAIEVPVAFHVLRRSNGSWDVSDQQINRQIEVLNDSFTGSGISFVLESVRRRDKNRFAKKCYSEPVERRLKRRYAVDPSRTLNIYTCRPEMDILGWAYFPSDLPEDDPLHGVVLLYSALPGGSAAPFDEGDTAVHETGHYFGLFHTFRGKCTGKGDRIADTPAEKRPAYGCPLGRDTCPSPGSDPVRNFMDYSDDGCVEEFTPDQITRMLDQIATFKPSL